MIHGDVGSRAGLPPIQVVQYQYTPWGVIHPINVVLHAIGVCDIICCVLIGEAWKVANVVRFAKVVPRQDLNDIWGEVGGCYIVEALSEERV